MPRIHAESTYAGETVCGQGKPRVRYASSLREIDACANCWRKAFGVSLIRPKPNYRWGYLDRPRDMAAD